MMLQQTLTIPKATKHLSVDLSEPIPAGTATFQVEWIKPPENTKKDLELEAIEALCGLYESDGHDVDRFLERSHEEKLREFEIEERNETCRESRAYAYIVIMETGYRMFESCGRLWGGGMR